ncbi:unnamed protein product [Durusdinium trenchii]|uniref:Uncharacterized protein n=1 Tax=Durusdinium trenchii TaxID=1381693 RepID=A0ABP0JGA1_9DINO
MESTLRLRPFESAESETGWKDLDWRQEQIRETKQRRAEARSRIGLVEMLSSLRSTDGSVRCRPTVP